MSDSADISGLSSQVSGFSEYPCTLGTVIRHEAGSYIIATPDGRTIGILANTEPSPAQVEADIASPRVPPAPVPQVISRAEFIIALRRVLGLTEGGIYALIAQLPEGEPRETARDLFENAREFRRDNSFLLALAQLNASPPEAIDEVFRTGAALDLD